jgi:mono/diheme cytochrome c family protein
MSVSMRALLASLALLAAGPALAQDPGQAQYAATCSACHQPTGKGIKGAFPALAGDPFVLGDPQAVVDKVLNGKGGMPAWKGELDDAKVAQVVSYIRSAWGNSASPVTAAMVAAERAKSAPSAERGMQAH